MEFRQYLNLTLLFDKPAFLIGENIKGTLILETKKPSLIEKIILEVDKVEEWKLEAYSPVNLVEKICVFDLDLNNEKTLQKVQDSYLMLGGKNEIPFNFRIDKEVCACFEYPLPDKYCSVRYHLNVNIYSCHFQQLTWNHYLCLLSRPIINVDNQLLTKTIEKNIKKWNLIGLGSIKMTVTIPENNYKINSQIKINVHIDNTKGKDPTKEIKIKLMRYLIFYGKNKDTKFSGEKTVLETKFNTPVLPGGKQAFECIVYLKENDIKRYAYDKKNVSPYGINMENIDYYMPSIFSKLISCQYELGVSLYFNSYVSDSERPRVKFPIYIVHQSVLEYQNEIQRKNELDKMNQNNIFNIKSNNFEDKNNNNNINYNNFDNNKNIINNNLNYHNIKYNQNYYNKNQEDNLPSFETIESAHQNNITKDGNNIDNDNYNQLESAPAAFTVEPKNDFCKNINNNTNINQNNIYNNNLNNINTQNINNQFSKPNYNTIYENNNHNFENNYSNQNKETNIINIFCNNQNNIGNNNNINIEEKIQNNNILDSKQNMNYINEKQNEIK